MELYRINSADPRYEMAHHWHSDFELIRVISGSLKVSLNRREFVAEAGDAVFVNSETIHGAIPDDCIYDCIVFSNELLNVTDKLCGGFISDLLNHTIMVHDHFKAADKEITGAFYVLFDIMAQKGCYFEAMGALYSLFGVIIHKKLYSLSTNFTVGESATQNAKIKKVLSFMRKNYSEPLSLDQIASVAGMSSKYFCCFFKEMTRKSPVTYLNDYRIERASHKLIVTDMTITDIAYSCGFNDLSYFIKSFKAAKGITPNKFRKNNI